MNERAIKLYRRLNPDSRAVDHTTWYGSTGSVRRATCIYCRRVVATSSAKWRETVRSQTARREHGEQCAAQYLRKHRRAAVGTEKGAEG